MRAVTDVPVEWTVASETLCVCPYFKRKMTWTINTKFNRNAVHGSRSACINFKVKGKRHAVIRSTAGVVMQVNMIG